MGSFRTSLLYENPNGKDNWGDRIARLEQSIVLLNARLTIYSEKAKIASTDFMASKKSVETA